TFVGVSAHYANLAAYSASLSAINARLIAARDRADGLAEEARRQAAEAARQAEEARRQAVDGARQRRAADAQRRLPDDHLHASRLREIRAALELGQVTRAQETLAAMPVAGRGGPGDDFASRYLRRLAYRDLALLRGHDRPVIALDLGPDGRPVSVDAEGGALV